MSHHIREPLTNRQWRAVEALVEGRSYAEAAVAGEVGPRQLYEWRQQPAFRLALEEALAELRAGMHGRLASLAELAVNRLARVLVHGEDRHAVRAALGVLDRAGYGKPEKPVEPVPVSMDLSHLSLEDIERLLEGSADPK